MSSSRLQNNVVRLNGPNLKFLYLKVNGSNLTIELYTLLKF